MPANDDHLDDLLPIIDISNLKACPDFDEDCQSMSLADIIACRDYEFPKLDGVCVELQMRQASPKSA